MLKHGWTLKALCLVKEASWKSTHCMIPFHEMSSIGKVRDRLFPN